MNKLITCIAAPDKAQEAVEQLDATYQIQAYVSHFSRGIGRSSLTSSGRGLGQHSEKTIISVLVPTSQSEEIFAFLYHVAGLNRPHGGIIYITAVKQAEISPIVNAQVLSTLQANKNVSEPSHEK